MITYKDAVTLAKKLKTLSSNIIDIELFGSVLANGKGRDADFLILVDGAIAKEWWKTERELIRIRWPDWLYGKRWIIKKFAHPLYVYGSGQRREKRLKVAANLMNLQLEQLEDSQGNIPDFEMFLVPPDWRVNNKINIDAMSRVTDLMQDKNTSGFLQRIAKDAVKVT